MAGGHYTVDQLFEGAALVSGNDAAEALAEAAGGRAQTVALMNRTALGLGAYDTFVQTPSGLDGWQQLTSAYDMTLFLRAALRDPRFVAYDTVRHTYAARTDDTAAGKRQHQKPCRCGTRTTSSSTTVPGALVAKTGYTDAAQHTFAGAISRGGHRYGVVFLRAQRYPQDQWVQAARLVAWARRCCPLAPRRCAGRPGDTTRPSRGRGRVGARSAGRARPPASSSSSSSGGSNSHVGVKVVIAARLPRRAGVYLTRRLRREAERSRQRRRAEEGRRPR